MKSNIYIVIACAAAAVLASVAVILLMAKVPLELAGWFEHWFNALPADAQRTFVSIAKPTALAMPGLVSCLVAIQLSRRRAKTGESDQLG